MRRKFFAFNEAWIKFPSWRWLCFTVNFKPDVNYINVDLGLLRSIDTVRPKHNYFSINVPQYQQLTKDNPNKVSFRRQVLHFHWVWQVHQAPPFRPSSTKQTCSRSQTTNWLPEFSHWLRWDPTTSPWQVRLINLKKYNIQFLNNQLSMFSRESLI